MPANSLKPQAATEVYNTRGKGKSGEARDYQTQFARLAPFALPLILLLVLAGSTA